MIILNKVIGNLIIFCHILLSFQEKAAVLLKDCFGVKVSFKDLAAFLRLSPKPLSEGIC